MPTSRKKPKQNMTITELGRHFNVARQTIEQCIKRHSVKPVSPGRYSTVDVAEARARGKEMDKAAKASEPRPRVGSLQDTKLQRQIDKLEVEIEAARNALRKELGELASVQELSNWFVGILSEISQAVDTWQQAEQTKRPELRDQIDRAAKSWKKLVQEKARDVSDGQ